MHQLEKAIKGVHFGCLHDVAPHKLLVPNSKPTNKMGYLIWSAANAILTMLTPACDSLATYSSFLPLHALMEASKLDLNTNSTF
jgi:hypothetical protein